MKDATYWLTAESPGSLLYNAKQMKVLTSRKSLLFSCGCYRLIWDRISLAAIREAVEMVEERADRKVTWEDVSRLRYRYPRDNPARATVNWYLSLSISSLLTAKVIPTHVAWQARVALDPQHNEHRAKWEHYKPQADLVREIIGNPYRPVTFDKAWRTAAVTSIAQASYESRDFSAMPILADALQDTGCDSEDVLSHCRDAGRIHVRGCWVVDLVLGKK
jgi:hypothetical protein